MAQSTLSARIGSKDAKTRLFSSLRSSFIPVAASIWIFGTIGQCANVAALRNDVAYLKTRPITTQIGKNRAVVLSEPLTPEENREAFVLETLPNLFALTPFRSTKDRNECKSQAKASNNGRAFKACDEVDRGVRVDGVGVVPSQTIKYQKTISPEAQRAILRFIASQVPKGYAQGKSRLLSIDGIGKQEVVNEQRKEYRVAMVATLEDYGRDGVRTGATVFDSWIYLREVIPPVPAAQQTPLQAIVAASIQRGLNITKIRPM
jgi:hypothetical protein